MIKLRSDSHTIAGAFVFLLLGLFALFSVMLVLLCAGAYNRVAAAGERNNQTRISPAYLRTMVRGHDFQGGIRTEKLTGILREDEDTGETSVEPVELDALVLDDADAVTRLFVYEGWLYECSEPRDEETDVDGFAEETASLTEGVCQAACMQPVTEAEAMEAELKDGLLVFRLQANGQWTEVACALHTAIP